MIYIGNAFAINMIRGDAVIKVTTITKKDFLEAGQQAYSIIGHPEIADLFNLRLNRESITLTRGDVLYVVTPTRRPHEGQNVPSGTKYEFIPESEGYTYTRVEVSE